MVKVMAPDPLILALANPNPEIMPEEATAIRPDAMICTGRSDYPNQVNNVLCFPYIFRGALDVGASTINEAMKRAAVNAIAELARETPSDVVARAYGGEARVYGKDSLIPAPFDPRLILRVAPAVARAAMESGVATRPLADIDAYAESLQRFVFRSGFIMRQIFAVARKSPGRVIYADGEDERVLRAAQVVIEEGIASPILVGRPAVIESRIKRYGLTIRPGTDFAVVNPDDDPRYRDYVATLVEVAGRRGITPDAGRTMVRTSTTVIAAIAMRRGEADAMICGLEGRYRAKLRHIRNIIGLAPGVREFAAMSLMITSRGIVFLADTHVQADPSADAIADTVVMCARHVERFGIAPKIALVAHSDFGDFDTPSSLKMRQALQLVHERAPGLEIDGEMQADTALIEAVRNRKLPGSTLKGEANLLVMPDLSAANVAYQIVKVFGEALPVGPILLGTARPAHILTGSVTSRGVVNMTAIAVAEAATLAAAAG
jgi:malate dehydrogenase (oxaloacetate-decarboxylating)(NADP+)